MNWQTLICIFVFVIIYIYYNHIREKEIINYVPPLKYIKNIPKIIYRTHFFSKGKNVSNSLFKYCHKEWIRLNPDYQMIWFTDRDIELFMKEKTEKKIYDAFKKLKPGAFKSDLWRSCFLFENGGIYIDSFARPFKSMKYILKGYLSDDKPNFVSVKDVDHKHIDGNIISGIHNGFLVASKNHPFLKAHIDMIVENVEKEYYGNHFLDVTGPFCLTRAINKFNEYDENKKPKIGYNKGKINFFLYSFTFGPYQTISKNGEKIIIKKYSILSLLYEKIIKIKRVYSYMWKHKDIYNA